MTTMTDIRDLAGVSADLDPRIHFLNLVVFLDDGRVFDCRADQRDMRRAFTALGVQDPSLDQLGFPRACAWAALTRTGVLEMGWQTFDKQTIEVQAAEDEPVTPVDPTPAVSDG
jgi:hypothetical protein